VGPCHPKKIISAQSYYRTFAPELKPLHGKGLFLLPGGRTSPVLTIAADLI
jgi:hypothetical protein